MISIKKLAYFVIGILPVLTSCEDKVILGPLVTYNNDVCFYSRECKYMTGRFLWLFKVEAPYVEGGITYATCRKDDLEGDMGFHIDVSSFTQDMANGQDDERFLTSPDPDMEKQIYDELFKYAEPCGRVTHVVEYRKEICRSLSVTASERLFGRGAGECLNDKLEFVASGDWWNECLFDEDRKMVGRVWTGMSIQEYLDLNPIMLPYALFRVKEVPQEKYDSITFTFTVILESGTVLNCDISVP